MGSSIVYKGEEFIDKLSDLIHTKVNYTLSFFGGGFVEEEFEEMKWKVVSEKQISDDEWSVEYTGSLGDKDLHFYARAISKNGKVYLATAVAKETQWATVSDTLLQHIQSFKVK